MMRRWTPVLLLASFLLLAGLADSYSAISIPKRKSFMKQTRSRPQASQSGVPPVAKHKTYREELPGKHRDGAWFFKNPHKPKTNKKSKSSGPGGRVFAYGKVSWW